MRIKKLLALAMATTIVASTFVGCGKKEAATTKTEMPKEPQTIEFWTMQLSPTFDGYLKSAITAFQTKYPNITVKWTDIPWGDMETKIMAAAAANTMPDVVNLNPHFAQKLAQLNALVDMEKAATDVKKDYFEGAWKASSFQGKTFGLPWYLTNGITYVNKDLLTKAGLDPAKLPTTYEEMYDAAKKIKEKTGKYGFFVTFKDQLGMEAFEQAGVRLFNDDFTKATFTSKEAIDRANFFKKMVEEGLMPKDVLTEGTGKAIQMYSAGEVAMFQGGTSHAGMIEKNNVDIYNKTVVGQALTNKDGKSNVAVMNVCVAEASKSKVAATEFAKFITNAEQQVEFAKASGAIIPSTKASIADAFFNITNGTTKELARSISAKNMEKTQVIFPPVKNFAEIKTAFMSSMQKVIAGEKDAATALKEAEDAANAALAK